VHTLKGGQNLLSVAADIALYSAALLTTPPHTPCCESSYGWDSQCTCSGAGGQTAIDLCQPESRVNPRFVRLLSLTMPGASFLSPSVGSRPWASDLRGHGYWWPFTSQCDWVTPRYWSYCQYSPWDSIFVDRRSFAIAICICIYICIYILYIYIYAYIFYIYISG